MYKEATRRAGSKHGVTGLTKAEVALRTEYRNARADLRNGQGLALRWSQREITFETMSNSDWALLQNQWYGIHELRLSEIKRRRGDRNIKMPEIWCGQ